MATPPSKRRWLLQATLGLLLLGAGLSMTIDSAFVRESGKSLGEWFPYATGALIVFMSGLSVFVDAVRHRPT